MAPSLRDAISYPTIRSEKSDNTPVSSLPNPVTAVTLSLPNPVTARTKPVHQPAAHRIPFSPRGRRCRRSRRMRGRSGGKGSDPGHPSNTGRAERPPQPSAYGCHLLPRGEKDLTIMAPSLRDAFSHPTIPPEKSDNTPVSSLPNPVTAVTLSLPNPVTARTKPVHRPAAHRIPFSPEGRRIQL